MKLTTKRDRWYFYRELFSYMIPMILIVWTIDVFLSFMQCPLHPEYSAPCSVNWVLAIMYGIFLILVIICAIISSRMLRNVKKKIEIEFLETVNNHAKEQPKEDKVKNSKPKNSTIKKDKKVEKKDTENRKVSKKVVKKKVMSKK